jgi:hypothetical protein
VWAAETRVVGCADWRRRGFDIIDSRLLHVESMTATRNAILSNIVVEGTGELEKETTHTARFVPSSRDSQSVWYYPQSGTGSAVGIVRDKLQ